jgi:hypothetical protein
MTLHNPQGLVPMVDLVNHDFFVENTNELVLTKPANVVYYLVRAPNNVVPGVEFLQQYNSYPEHSKYLYYYGFLHDDLQFDQGDYIALSTDDGAGVRVQVVVLADGKVPASFIAAVHAGARTTNRAAGVGTGVRAGGLNRLFQVLTAEIAQLPTSLHEDLGTLAAHRAAGNDFDGVHGVALLLRCRFKKVLARTLAWVRDEMVKNAAGDGVVVVESSFDPRYALYGLDLV